jgi:DDE superfamily endonuclease
MPDTYEEIEDRIQQVLDSILPDSTPNFTRLAKENNVPYKRLLARYHGRPTLFERPSGTLKLSETQNVVLREFIRFLDQLGVSARVAHVVRCANTILQADHTDSSLPLPSVTIRWARAWIKRQDDIFIRRQRHLDLNRQLAHDIDGIQKWFDGFIKIILDYGINPADIWNFDETGFRIGIGKDQWIITYEPNRRHFMAAPGNRESMTSIESVNAIGDAIDPMLVIQGSQFLARYFTDLPDQYCIATSDTGYVNDEICLNWVKHWEKESRTMQQGVWRLLLFDGFDSHLTKEFLDVLELNKIIPYRLIPHSTHLV